MSNDRCQACQSFRVLSVSGKVNDCFSAWMQDKKYYGGVPEGLNLEGGDYLGFDLCLDCGQIQGKFPVDLDLSEWEPIQ